MYVIKNNNIQYKNYKDFKFEDILIALIIEKVYKNSTLDIKNDNLSSADLKNITNQLELNFVPQNIIEKFSNPWNLINFPEAWYLFSSWKEEGDHINYSKFNPSNFKHKYFVL